MLALVSFGLVDSEWMTVLLCRSPVRQSREEDAKEMKFREIHRRKHLNLNGSIARGCPNRGLQALPDGPAICFDFPKVVPANNVLEQMRHFRRRAPLATG
jgi:hypothetical protein